MPIQLTPPTKVKCTYNDCLQSFDTLKEMKAHKLSEPDHNYCKKCDVDCGDWDDFTQHKVNAMAPWLEGSNKEDRGENPKHIVCEFCGEDFKSFGGRKLHRKQMHQALQSINCPGCNNIFVKAALLIGHLERGRCKEIPAWEFRGHIQQKFISKEVLKNPEAFTFMTPVPEPIPDLDEPITPSEPESEGGVRIPLLDEEDEYQQRGQAPLTAEVDLITLQDGTRFPLTRANLETWPRLPGQKKSDVSSYLKGLSVSSDTGTSISQVSASEITSRCGGVKVYTPSRPSLQSPPMQSLSFAPTEASSDDGSSSANTACADKVLKCPAAWKEQTTHTLFPKAKATPPDEVVRSILKKREEMTQPMNPLKARWWEPGSKDYNPNLFFHSVTQKYCCPFPDCDQLPFDTPFDIDAHFMEIHARMKYRCSSCCKLFRCAEGLVAHCESNGNCPVQKHNDFDKLLDEITGGFLKAKRLPQPAIVRTDKTVVKPDEHRPGVMPMLYKAKMPDDPYTSGVKW